MTHPSVARALAIAASLEGRGETGSNNSGPFVAMLHRGRRATGNWCAAFVAYCLEEAGVVPPLTDRQRRGAKGLAKTVARLYGRWVVRPGSQVTDVRADPGLVPDIGPGDVVAWRRTLVPGDWRGHVEIVDSYDDITDTLVCWAGNVGPAPSQHRPVGAPVHRRTHPRGSWRARLYGVSRVIP